MFKEGFSSWHHNQLLLTLDQSQPVRHPISIALLGASWGSLVRHQVAEGPGACVLGTIIQ